MCGRHVCSPLLQEPLVHSVLWTQGSVVGAVSSLFAEVDVGADTALEQGLSGPRVVTHTHEDLIGLVLAQQPKRMHVHLCDIDRLVDNDPGGGLVAGRDGDGALVGDVAGGVRVKVCYI